MAQKISEMMCEVLEQENRHTEGQELKPKLQINCEPLRQVFIYPVNSVSSGSVPINVSAPMFSSRP